VACWQPSAVTHPRPRYVDFDAAYDGPVLEHMIDGAPRISVDDLVICEKCLGAAARLLGFEPAEETREEITEVQAQMAEVMKDNREKDKMISHLEYTVDTLIDHPVQRPAGKPQIKGPASRKDELKEIRSRRARAEKISKSKQKVPA
jgi:hypothetical protein